LLSRLSAANGSLVQDTVIIIKGEKRAARAIGHGIAFLSQICTSLSQRLENVKDWGKPVWKALTTPTPSRHSGQASLLKYVERRELVLSGGCRIET
jgi:hypothetical protein